MLDGAHTRESAAALRTTLDQVFPGRPLVFVVAMAADKEHRAVMEELRACHPRAVIFTSASIAGSQSRSCAPGNQSNEARCNPVLQLVNQGTHQTDCATCCMQVCWLRTGKLLS